MILHNFLSSYRAPRKDLGLVLRRFCTVNTWKFLNKSSTRELRHEFSVSLGKVEPTVNTPIVGDGFLR